MTWTPFFRQSSSGPQGGHAGWGTSGYQVFLSSWSSENQRSNKQNFTQGWQRRFGCRTRVPGTVLISTGSQCPVWHHVVCKFIDWISRMLLLSIDAPKPGWPETAVHCPFGKCWVWVCIICTTSSACNVDTNSRPCQSSANMALNIDDLRLLLLPFPIFVQPSKQPTNYAVQLACPSTILHPSNFQLFALGSEVVTGTPHNWLKAAAAKRHVAPSENMAQRYLASLPYFLRTAGCHSGNTSVVLQSTVGGYTNVDYSGLLYITCLPKPRFPKVFAHRGSHQSGSCSYHK